LSKSDRNEQQITIAVGYKDGVADDIGRALAMSLQDAIHGLRVQTRTAQGVDGNLEALKTGKADLGFVDSEGAYVAYRQEKADRETAYRLRSIAMLYPTAVQIFVKRSLNLQSIAQLRGRRIIVGTPGDYADRTMRLILESYGLNYDTVHPLFIGPVEARTAMKDGTADALVFYTPFRSQAITDINADLDLELLSVDHANIAEMQAASERNHFLKTITIPKDTYPGQTRDALTIGDEILLLCRAELDESLVTALTQTLFDSIPVLIKAHPAAATVDVERGPSTSVPLHPGAARYYRERELPR
jgi:TRAP transporter TAXI family solute receptor